MAKNQVDLFGEVNSEKAFQESPDESGNSQTREAEREAGSKRHSDSGLATEGNPEQGSGVPGKRKVVHDGERQPPGERLPDIGPDEPIAGKRLASQSH
jgi:hypothetical protein